jgi:hypothetical protein
VSIGSAEAHVQLSVNSQTNSIGCNFYILKNDELFKFLLLRREEIESEIGEKAEWTQAKIDSLTKIKKDVSDVFSAGEAEKCFEWLYEKMVLFKSVFGKYLKEFKEHHESNEL